MEKIIDLKGKHVLITGASSGIGKQCAIGAARLGANVTLIARDVDKLTSVAGKLLDVQESDCASYSADLSEVASIGDLISTIVLDRGPVDAFCHCAGIAHLRPLKYTTPELVEETMRINLLAFIELVRCLSRGRNLNSGASLVGVSSVAASNGGPGQAAYAASKAGMQGFMHSVAKELGRRGVRINLVAFAMVGTEMLDEVIKSGEVNDLLSRQYLGVISPEGASDSIMFLMSEASRFMTDSVLPVYAGYR